MITLSDTSKVASHTSRPMRSALYIPGSNARALEKAKSLSCDAIIFDLEDAVAPDEKDRAREALFQALQDGDYGARAKIVRINGLETPWGAADVEVFATADIEGLLLPKVESTQMLDDLAKLAPNLPLWAMMETPLGMLNAVEIAEHSALVGMVMGTNDLAKDLNTRFCADRMPLMASLQLCLLAAKAHGCVILDGVFNAFKDQDGLAFECKQGRDLGFDGKTLIHPAQLAEANVAFAPSAAELDLAERQIEAFAVAIEQGTGVAVVDGQIVESLHIQTARETIAKAEMIKAME